jgi:CTP synthase
MLEQGLDLTVMRKMALPIKTEPPLTEWREFLQKLKNPKHSVRIGLVGKYVELPDAYKSIAESFIHSGAMNECDVDVEYIHSEDITEANVAAILSGMNGILVAPGFGSRGIEGKIFTAKFARENNIPFFGICLGMQCAVIEFGRNVLNLEGAHSTEINHKTKFPVIDLMEEQKSVIDKGGTMRLGGYKCVIDKSSRTYKIYSKDEIVERHRHRYEFNNKYFEDYKSHGMIPVGTNPESGLVEIIEIPDHKWFIGVQFHPEYSSTVINPHPLFVSFIKACIG